MSELENVTLVKAANIYFDGKVVSRTVRFADGSRKTLGFMQAGDYTFGTQQAEVVEVLGGSASVQLDGENDWRSFAEGASFAVPANSSFKLRIDDFMDYCCSYE